MGGHATHDEREARATFDATLFSHWGKRDPIGIYETYLIESEMELETGRRAKHIAGLRERNAEMLRSIESRVTKEVEQAAREALESTYTNMPTGESAAEGVYAEAKPALNEAVAAS
jgi:TPP-dependent pyruvate/acetoin dehydrogenase alpha subunit